MKFKIAMISDYFYPSVGGIETHIMFLSRELIKMGHKVIIITHKYKSKGVIYEGRYIIKPEGRNVRLIKDLEAGFYKGKNKYGGIFAKEENGFQTSDLVVYYLTLPIIAKNTTFPSFSFNRQLVDVLLEEGIQIVHAHQSMSYLAMEGVLFGSLLNDLKNRRAQELKAEKLKDKHRAITKDLSTIKTTNCSLQTIKTVFTEHSLFEIGSLENIIVNSFNKFILRNTTCIAVSYTAKENLSNRIDKKLEDIYVIPNGIDGEVFDIKDKPRANKSLKWTQNRHVRKMCDDSIEFDPIDSHFKNNNNDATSTSDRSDDFVNDIFKNKNKIFVVIVSRLVYRKGIDLLLNCFKKIFSDEEDENFINDNRVFKEDEILNDKICHAIGKLKGKFEFVIIGDGPKKIHLENFISQKKISQIHLLGELSHCQIASIFQRCDIFLNTSLTESFCMTIIEAAACGLFVVSTNVGAIHEVLPEEVMLLCRPDCISIIEALLMAEEKMRSRCICRDLIRSVFSWRRIAMETENVYLKLFEGRDDCVKFNNLGRRSGKCFEERHHNRYENCNRTCKKSNSDQGISLILTKGKYKKSFDGNYTGNFLWDIYYRFQSFILGVYLKWKWAI